MCGYFVFSMWTVTHFLRWKKEKKYRFSYMTTVPTINGDFSIPIELCTTFWPLLYAKNQSFTFIIYTYTYIVLKSNSRFISYLKEMNLQSIYYENNYWRGGQQMPAIIFVFCVSICLLLYVRIRCGHGDIFRL